MIIKNYTGRDIVVSDGVDDIAVIMSEEKAPKVFADNELRIPFHFTTTDGHEFRSNILLGRDLKVVGLPEKERETMFVVPSNVLKICGAEREDLIAVGEVSLDSEGKTFRVFNFKKYDKRNPCRKKDE